MKHNVLLAAGAVCAMLLSANNAFAQDEVTVSESVSEGIILTDVPCNTNYYTTPSQNWYIQLGAGIASPFVEDLGAENPKHHITANYNLGFGKWMSPYLGWRISFLGGALHWENVAYSKSKYVTANFDLMWDMFNSFNVNPKRVFSIIPFVGLGGAYVWDFENPSANCMNKKNEVRKNQWMLPVSAGLQLRFRLSKYVDFFAEGRAQFYGDNFNNTVWGQPVDVNLTCTGGFAIYFTGREFNSYNPCDYMANIAALNDEVNALRGEVAASAAALAACEAQLPCPEVTAVEEVIVQQAPLMAAVRFKINSAKISPMEQVNVYNVAQWMKANPEANVAIVGYADKDTGTSSYNMGLSERRANAVYDMLTKDYGINPARLTKVAKGSDTQIYDENNWNRIVVFENE